MAQKIYEYFLYFVLYSVIGWCYEVFLEVAVYNWGFSNRGVLFGPYCVVYGFGALLILFLFERFKKQRLEVYHINVMPLLIFIGIALAATAVELAASYIMELICGGWMWDYTRFAFNFQGRIALNPSIRFGIGGMVFLYLIQPALVKLKNALKEKGLKVTSTVLMITLFSDLIYTFLIK